MGPRAGGWVDKDRTRGPSTKKIEKREREERRRGTVVLCCASSKFEVGQTHQMKRGGNIERK